MDQTPPKEGRSPVSLRIKFRSESLEQFIERYAIDVSRGGIFIRTREPLAVGTQLKLDFQYQSGGALMAGEGTVVWIREPDPARPNIPPGMGVRFDRLSPESQVVLELLLADKAKRDKAGVSPALNANLSGAGMAVRRPSSMFAALEPPATGAKVMPPVAFPSVEPAPPASSRAVGPPPRVGAVTSIMIVPIEGKSPGSGTAAPAAPARPEPARRTESTAVVPPTTASPATASAPSLSEGAAGGYRPLGTARNPFSGARPSGSFPVSRPAPTPSARERFESEPAREPARDTDRAVDAAGQDDDLNEEPTQIAGRVPAFLLSEEDPTSVGSRGSDETGAHRTAEGLAETSRANARSAASTQGASEVAPGRDAVSGEESPRTSARPGERFTGPLQALVSELSKPKQSLDLAPPLGNQEPAPPPGGERTTEGSLDAPSTPSGRVATGRAARAPDALSLAVAAPDVPPAPRKRSGALIGGLVVVLGVAAFFVFRFFASQHASPVASPAAAPATSVSAAEPVAPAVQAPAATTGAATSAPSAKPDTLPPSSAKEAAPAAPAKQEQTAEPPAIAPSAGADGGGPSPPATAPTAKPPAEAAKPPARVKNEPPKPIAAVEPPAANPRKPVRRRIARSGHEADVQVGAAKSPAGQAPAEAPPAAAADKPAGDTHVDAAALGHQLRVTSKPPGADVTIDGQVVGQTPLATAIPDVSAPHFVSVHKDGYEPFEQMISASSAWTKGRPTKGQPAVPTLKLNAKLKAIGGTGDAKPPSGEAAPAKDAPGAKPEEARQDRTLPPSDDRMPPSAP